MSGTRVLCISSNNLKTANNSPVPLAHSLVPGQHHDGDRRGSQTAKHAGSQGHTGKQLGNGGAVWQMRIPHAAIFTS